MPERVRAPRQALRLHVTVWQPADEGVRTSGLLTNVSSGGAYIATYEPLPPQAPAVIELEYAGRAVHISARVVHNENAERAEKQTMFRAGMGVSFDRPDDPDVVELAGMGEPLVDGGGRRRESR